MVNKNTSMCGPSCCITGSSQTENDPEEEACKVEKEFTDRTSCHGISYWCNSVNNFQRMVWIVLVLGSTGMMIFQVHLRIFHYFQYESTTSISRHFVNEIDIPAITICNYNRYFGPDDPKEIDNFHLLNRISSPTFVAYAATHDVPHSLHALEHLDAIPNFTISNYLDLKGYQLQDDITLKYCRLKSTRCDASSFNSILTRLGKCYTYNSDPSVPVHQAVAGFGQGLSLVLDAQYYNYTEEPLYGHHEAGVMFQVHSQQEVPNVEMNGVAIPVGHKAYAAVYRKDSEIMYAPWGQCHPDTQKTLKYFSIYSLHMCMLECYTDHLISYCGCRTFDQYWASNYAAECTPRQVENCSTPYTYEIEHNLTHEACQCTLPCNFTEYFTTVSYATFPGIQTRIHYEDNSGISPEILQENSYVALDVTFSEIGYLKEKQSKKIDESSLTSDIGGQLGLWVGMSFLTMAEVIQYLIVRIYTTLTSPRKKSSKKDQAKLENVVSSTWSTNLQTSIS